MEKKDIKDKKILNYLLKLFLIFVICSIFGFIIETVSISLVLRTLEIRKGLVYGPFVQVYGIGGVAYYLLVTKIKEPKKVFVLSMLLGGAVEYLTSFLQEVFLGKVSWDYSDSIIHFNGRTSIEYMIIWGIIGVIFLKGIYPIFQKLLPMIYFKKVRAATYVLLILMSFNIWISSVSALRQMEREDGIAADSKLDVLLDKYYPDEMLNKIYHNRYDPDEFYIQKI